MRVSKSLFSVVACSLAVLFCINIAEANFIKNGDFSTGTLSDWEPVARVTATDLASLPGTLTSNWDLSPWNSKLDGTFALFQGGVSQISSNEARVSNRQPFRLTLDYAVAWSDPQSADAFGSFSVQTFGRYSDGSSRVMSFKEIDWTVAVGQTSDVFTGSLLVDNFIQFADLILEEVSLAINVQNPNRGLTQIVGIDNVSLDTLLFRTTQAAVVPEPATVLLLGLGLIVGLGLRKKF